MLLTVPLRLILISMKKLIPILAFAVVLSYFPAITIVQAKNLNIPEMQKPQSPPTPKKPPKPKAPNKHPKHHKAPQPPRPHAPSPPKPQPPPKPHM
jgi:hypothetical protein